MASIMAFANEKGLTLRDSADIEKKCAAQCRAIAAQMNKAVIEQFKKF